MYNKCYVLDTQLNKVGSSSELIYFYKQQNIIRGNYDKLGVLLFLGYQEFHTVFTVISCQYTTFPLL